MYCPRGYEMLTNGNQTATVVTNEKPRNWELFGTDQSLDVSSQEIELD